MRNEKSRRHPMILVTSCSICFCFLLSANVIITNLTKAIDTISFYYIHCGLIREISKDWQTYNLLLYICFYIVFHGVISGKHGAQKLRILLWLATQTNICFTSSRTNWYSTTPKHLISDSIHKPSWTAEVNFNYWITACIDDTSGTEIRKPYKKAVS